ncbi:MAG: MFS transporter [bacterium]|nr:MFS transporter [bacterium]
MKATNPLRSLEERNVQIFLGGLTISFIGTWAHITAAVFLVQDLGGAGIELGVLTASQFIPMLLFSMYAGSLADRVDRHRMTLITQTLMGLLALSMGIIDLANLESLAVVYALTACIGTVAAFDNPARRGFATEMVPAERLTNILSLSTSVVTAGRIVGPAVASLLVGVIGTAWVFLLNGFSFLAFLAAMIKIDHQRLFPVRRATRTAKPVREGLAEVWADPILRVSVLVFALVSAFAYNYVVSFPLLVADQLKAPESFFGWLLSALSIGNLVGSLTIARLEVVSQRWQYGGATAAALLLTVVSLSTQRWLTLSVAVFLGWALTLFLNSSGMILQQRTSPQMRSRVLALQAVIIVGTTPIGGPITGLVGDLYGGMWANLLGAITAMAAVLLGLGLLRRITGTWQLPPEKVAQM